MNSSKDKKIRTSVIVLLVIVGLSLIPWAFAAFVSLFAFDAPGSEKQLYTWLIVIPVWIYPLLAVGCMTGSIVLKRRNKLCPALVVIAIPLVAIVLWAIFTGIYAGLQPQ